MKPLAAWPLDDHRKVREVLTGFDGTLATYRRFTPDMLSALERLMTVASGIHARGHESPWRVFAFRHTAGTRSGFVDLDRA